MSMEAIIVVLLDVISNAENAFLELFWPKALFMEIEFNLIE